MRENELLSLLQNFEVECIKANRSLIELTVVPYIESENNYSLQITTTWAESSNSDNAMNELLGILWRTTTVECRKSIFEIKLYRYNSQPKSFRNEKTMIGHRALGVFH